MYLNVLESLVPAQTLAAELVPGKDGGRASLRTMAALLAILAALPAHRNRGFVLDGWPKSLAPAKIAFMRLQSISGVAASPVSWKWTGVKALASEFQGNYDMAPAEK